MNSADSREQEAGLGVGELPKNHARDVHVLSFAFLFIFLAYGAAQNLESTVNTVSWWSLVIRILGFICFDEFGILFLFRLHL